MTSVPDRRIDIPGLTGLRFVAAFCVVISHGLHGVQGFGPLSGLTYLCSQLSAIGMSLFFVLSGFVIHYNYREAIAFGGARGHWNFFVARFSRLYPLYFVVVVGELFVGGFFHRLALGHTETITKFVAAAPYYLTLSHTWFYELIGSHNLIYQFGRAASISWSISTEWFFYLLYPLILAGLMRLGTQVLRFSAICVLTLSVAGFVVFVAGHVEEINGYAISRYGIPASTEPIRQDSLYRWILYFSPYARIGEFILGVLTCAFVLGFRNPPGRGEQRIGLYLAVLAVVCLAALHYTLYALNPDTLIPFRMVYGYALPIAVLIFCAARYANPITRFLSWRPMVLAGEVSYSLYFLHIVVLGWLAGRGFMAVDQGDLFATWGVALSASAIALALSFVTYRLIEVPARWWLRKALSERREGAADDASPAFRLAAAPTRLMVAMLLFFLPLAVIAVRPPAGSDVAAAQAKALVPGDIEVLEASYGVNCGARPGNATPDVARQCSGTATCGYTVDVRRLGDPAGGCGKDFSVTWRCDRDAPAQTAAIAPEAGIGGKSVTLTCPRKWTLKAG